MRILLHNHQHAQNRERLSWGQVSESTHTPRRAYRYHKMSIGKSSSTAVGTLEQGLGVTVMEVSTYCD